MNINKTKNENRNDLAIMFDELGLKRGAEIGVRTGRFSEILCTYVKSLEKLYSIDPWDLVPEDSIGRDHIKKYGSDIFNRYYRMAQRRLRKYPACEMIRKTSMEAVRNFEYESLDFVYIDGAHTFDYVMTDIVEWTKRVRRGGIVAGDDYKIMRKGNVILAVDTYAKAHGITLNVMYHEKPTDHSSATWWFIKQ